MCIDEKKFDSYMNKAEGLLSEVRVDNIKIREEITDLTKDVAAVKSDTKDLRRDIGEIKRDTKKTENHLKNINGKIQEHDEKIYAMDLARSPEYRAVGCPQATLIQELSESIMSAAVLREYLKEREKKNRQNMVTIITIATAVFALVAVLTQIFI
jgi:chromosome segregation ATPase